ncbi:ATP-dependent DNA helicase CHL1 (Chromosome loss protein 1) [Durusdinium trenchii]|uniref:ATP-dependent DNA helicase CHL1 (Chromosome loss protein 1) n=1 Tax=Durusdinium trenchii TaxID=1381693 RepID=A0ABP0P675_9DINO
MDPNAPGYCAHLRGANKDAFEKTLQDAVSWTGAELEDQTQLDALMAEIKLVIDEEKAKSLDSAGYRKEQLVNMPIFIGVLGKSSFSHVLMIDVANKIKGPKDEAALHSYFQAFKTESSEGGPETYGFPHPPYPSQLDFMAKVYETLEMGGVAVLESPTGTGKTLSLLCPSLSWLRQQELSIMASKLAPEEDADGWAEPLRAQARASAEYVWKRRRERRELRQRRARQSMALTASGAATVPRPMKQRRTADVEQSSRDEAEEGDLSLEAPLQLETVKVPEKAQEDLFAEKLQIIFCSRTHSQLAQVLREIRGIPSSAVPENLAVVTLGSRQSLCIHSVVRSRAKGAGHFNDLCRLATEEGATRSLRCEWKKSAEVMADAFLSEMMDIEGMTERGRAPVGGGCPYYGGRRAVQEADVLLVPYQSLVNKETREKLNLRTEGNVLIFDEAHNLLEVREG